MFIYLDTGVSVVGNIRSTVITNTESDTEMTTVRPQFSQLLLTAARLSVQRSPAVLLGCVLRRFFHRTLVLSFFFFGD